MTSRYIQATLAVTHMQRVVWGSQGALQRLTWTPALQDQQYMSSPSIATVLVRQYKENVSTSRSSSGKATHAAVPIKQCTTPTQVSRPPDSYVGLRYSQCVPGSPLPAPMTGPNWKERTSTYISTSQNSY